MDKEERLADYIKAADKGNWNLCRRICNSMGCGLDHPAPRMPDLTFMERQKWRRLFELADSPVARRDWPKVRAELDI